MDLAALKSAYDGLKMAKDIFSAFNELKNEADAIGKINEAVRRVGEAQDALYEHKEWGQPTFFRHLGECRLPIFVLVGCCGSEYGDGEIIFFGQNYSDPVIPDAEAIS